jgi:hypothetical protein
MAVDNDRDALPFVEKAVDSGAQAFGATSATMGELLALEQTAYVALRDFDRALEVGSRARSILEASVGAEHPSTLAARLNDAKALSETGHLEDAEREANAALAGRRALFGAESPEVAEVKLTLAWIRVHRGDLDDAIAKLNEANATLDRAEVTGVLSFNGYVSLARVLEMENRPREALDAATVGCERAHRALLPGHPLLEDCAALEHELEAQLAPPLPRTAEGIRAAIERNYAAVRYCYELAAPRGSRNAMNVGARLVVDRDGHVSSVRNTASTISDPNVLACVLDRCSRLRFEQGPAVTNLTYPIQIERTP